MSAPITNRRGQYEQPPRSFSFQEDLEDDAGVTVEELKANGELKPTYFQHIDTTPNDVRFAPNFNKARRCGHYFNMFLKCKNEKGESSECTKLLQASHTFCPAPTLQRMLEQVEEGSYPGPTF
uniref:Uncharacterized protein n=1 Tax=Palpitomonas bilix TaxID=652834 RepID=A0A7S3DG34_9EUKA|mmetsp:Transcript_36080/g.93837  ORF Transcript_36080/g.93837 Transcript_36080/m.93837 type:complete len:123 (+) Transcript_36080:55-423(+)